MLSDANPLTPYRYDKLAICGQSFSSTEVGKQICVAIKRASEAYLVSLAFSVLVCCRVTLGFHPWVLMHHAHQKDFPHSLKLTSEF